MNAPRIEMVVAYDEGARVYVELPVRVLASWTMRVDCGCWTHRKGTHDYECIATSAGAVYFRAEGSQDHFRVTATVGPITTFLDEQKRYRSIHDGEERQSTDEQPYGDDFPRHSGK